MSSTDSEAALQAYLDEDYTWFPMRCGVASIVMVTVAYILRFWSRHLQIAPWSWFDWLMIPGYLSNVGMGVCGIVSFLANKSERLKANAYSGRKMGCRTSSRVFAHGATSYFLSVGHPILLHQPIHLPRRHHPSSNIDSLLVS